MQILDKVVYGVSVGMILSGIALVGIGYGMKTYEAKAPYERSVVFIGVDHMHGTGVIIGNQLVVTAGHVAKAARPDGSMDVKLGDHFTTGTVRWYDVASDTALLSLDKPLAGSVAADLSCNTSDAVVGDELETVGNPLNFTNLHTWGRVAKNKEAYDIDADHHALVALIGDMTIAPGNSGGPAFTNRHTIAGITNAIASFVVGGMFPAFFPLTYIVPKSVICHQLSIQHPEPVFEPAPVAAAPIAPPLNIVPKPKPKGKS